MNSRQQLQRAEIADMAARIICDEGLRDYQAAKIKAARRLGYPIRTPLPGNVEIEQALKDYQLIFLQDQPELLRTLRLAAIEAMAFFEAFRPRLVGPVLTGTADRFSAVCLHLFCETPEDVALFLHDKNIPYDLAERTFKWGDRSTQSIPSVTFAAGEVPIDLSLFYTDDIRRPPVSPIDGKPMRRAGVSEVQQLVDEPVATG